MNNMFQAAQLHCNANSGGINDTASKEAAYNTTRDPRLCATDNDPISAHITGKGQNIISGRGKPLGCKRTKLPQISQKY